jgi:carboxypeptidase C (cathepsin A)
VSKQLSEYTGLDPRWILDKNLRIREREFAGQLLQGEGRSISVYDSRVTALGPYTGDDNDQGSFLLAGPLKTAMTAYLTEDLGVKTDRRYRSGNAQVYLDWNWESGRVPPVNADSINTGYPDISDDFAQAMNRCYFLKVFIASGLFDLEVPYDSVLYTIRHLGIPKERRENISMKPYPGGHMFYANPEAHRKLRKDLQAFYRQVLEGR